jgi:predicted DNA-binding transcriptional regulator YafY
MFFKKLGDQLRDDDQYTLANLDEVLSFRPFAQDDKELQYFETLMEAITERRVLKFQYMKPDDDEYRPRRVRPYHMMAFSGRMYVIGYGLDRKAERKFVPGRMRDVGVTEQRFAKPKDFDPKEYLKRRY